VRKEHEKRGSFFLLDYSILPPSRTAHSKKRAWRMSDYQVPIRTASASSITLDVERRVICRWCKIAGPGIMPTLAERLAHHAAKLTRDQDFHGFLSIWFIKLSAIWAEESIIVPTVFAGK
jgi:hypothetical protein